MKLRPLNRTLIIELEENMNQVDSKVIANALKSKLIILPENNTIEKISDHARVIRTADDCQYPYLKNQRICYKHLDTTLVWYEENGKRYRIIKEWDVNFIYEED